jgi:hypothetical protein
MAEAFHVQAQSDYKAYNALATTTLPVCHRLHYLQMWMEKLCKAYLWHSAVINKDLLHRHQVVGVVLPRLVEGHWRRLAAYNKSTPDMERVRSLCREIDLLHPQVDDNGRRPDNVEYPWTFNGVTYTPTQHTFPLVQDLYRAHGRLLIMAAAQITEISNILNPQIQ